jgi:hypothetical protein
MHLCVKEQMAECNKCSIVMQTENQGYIVEEFSLLFNWRVM